jgi:hypothetical protein
MVRTASKEDILSAKSEKKQTRFEDSQEERTANSEKQNSVNSCSLKFLISLSKLGMLKLVSGKNLKIKSLRLSGNLLPVKPGILRPEISLPVLGFKNRSSPEYLNCSQLSLPDLGSQGAEKTINLIRMLRITGSELLNQRSLSDQKADQLRISG